MVSNYLVAGAVAWVIAQFSKYIITSLKYRKAEDVSKLYLSGGMPSAHSATSVAVLTVIGIVNGTDSGIFALAALFTSIVLYDAMMVRRSSGEQGMALRSLMTEQKSKVRKPFVALGHSWQEVCVGSALGFIVGVIVAAI